MGQFDVHSGVTDGVGATTLMPAAPTARTTATIKAAESQVARSPTEPEPFPASTDPDGSPWRITCEVARWIGSIALVTFPLPGPPGNLAAGLVNSQIPAVLYDDGALHPDISAAIDVFRMKQEGSDDRQQPAARLRGSQTVERAVDILFAIGEQPMMLADLAQRVGLSTTTCYRLANALVSRGLLSANGRSGYSLGDRIGELGLALTEQRARMR